MNNHIKKLLSSLLCFVLLAALTVPVLAEDAQQIQAAVSIRSVEEFLDFAEKCRLDSYSKGLSVQLETDLDLTDSGFQGIPIFCGAFDGKGHTITGLSLSQSGSTQGFFRYLTDTASVKDLTIQAQLHPQGSSVSIGMLAGSNAGRIENCSVSGEVSGKDRVGGLVGSNLSTATIDGCRVSGSIVGNHFVGGIAGENSGVIRGSYNRAQINITAQQNNVEFSDISFDTMTGSESANTVTDVGGIAGTSAGVIRACENHGNVGYPHMGYNIGGIAGSQSGYVAECKNFGKISGRKEVGGIIGQMEPVTKVDFSEDTLQILQEQINTMSALTNQASANASSNTAAMNSQFSQLNQQIDNAKGAIDTLTPDLPSIDPNDPTIPDLKPSIPDKDSIIAAKNQLSSSMNAMMNTLDGIISSTQSAAQTLSSDMQAIADHASAMGSTINNASDHLGGTVTDVSDSDTDDDITGKAAQCINNGAVIADLNAGGIAGAAAIENDLDHEDDWQISSNRSLNFQSELRCVIVGCKNTAPISAKKRNAGGIVGRQAVGLTKDSINTGALEAENADSVGGIAGTSSGFIRRCSAKSALNGASAVGGIAGTATIVTDCRSMVQLTSEEEKLGAIVGIAETPDVQTDKPISGNFYLPVDRDLGGIDGISYSGMAEPRSMEHFLSITDLPAEFANVSVRFLFEDGSQKEVTVPLGSGMDSAQIPQIPKKEGYTGAWEDLNEADLASLTFDKLYRCVYTPLNMSIQSQQLRDDGRPILLAVGQFPSADGITLEPLGAEEALLGETPPIEAFRVRIQPSSDEMKLHYLPPAGFELQDLKIMVRSSDGVWRKVSAQIEGSYLLFSIRPEDDAFCAIETVSLPDWVLPAAGAAVAVLVVGGLVFRRKKRSRDSATAQAAT